MRQFPRLDWLYDANDTFLIGSRVPSLADLQSTVSPSFQMGCSTARPSQRTGAVRRTMISSPRRSRPARCLTSTAPGCAAASSASPLGLGAAAETVWLLRSGRGAGRELWRIQYAPLRTVFGRLQDPDDLLTAVAWLTVMNLMNGRNTDGRFRCLVNHDGIFDCATTYYTTEEL